MNKKAQKTILQNIYIDILLYQINSLINSALTSPFSKMASLSKSLPRLASNHPSPQFILDLFIFTNTSLLRIASYPWEIQKLSYRTRLTQEGFIKFSKHTLVSYLIVSTVLVGTGIIFLFNPFTGGPKEAAAAWFNDNWAYRKEVPITAHTAEETNEYIEVTVADTDDLVTAGQLQSDCGDFRFTKQNGEILPYYIASGCNSASTVININFNTFPAGAQTLYMYYGNPSVSNGASATDFSTEASNYTVGTIGSEEKAPSPTLYWKFDDAQGTTAKDSTTNALDGTLNNTPTWQADNLCVAGKCLYFDGSNNENVSKSDDSKLDFAASENFTISLWIKKSSTAAANSVILQKSSANIGSTYTGYKIYMDASGDFCFDIQDGSNSVDTACTSAVDFDDNKWHFVSGVKAGTSSITLYVNGEQRAQDASIASSGSLANSATLRVGTDSDGTSNDFLGFIDDVKVTRDNSARTAAQVKADFNAAGNPEGTATVLGASTQNMPDTLSNGLVGYWKMDEGSWTDDCSTASVIDSSGNGNNGTSCPSSDGPTGGAAGKYGRAGAFDGSDDRVEVVDNSILDFGENDNFTISVWANRDTNDSDDTVLAKRSSNDASSAGYSITMYSGGDVCTEVSDGTDEFETCLSTQITDSGWNHIVVVFDRNNITNTKMYLNGSPDEGPVTGTVTAVGSLANTQALAIGTESNNTNTPFDGRIDEVRVYNRAFSPAEVSKLYNWAPGPVGYWKMDEGNWTNDCSTDTVFDSSGNGYNGDSCPSSSGPTGGAVGKYGKAGSFDGSDDQVDVADTVALRVAPAGGFTIAAWIKTTDTSGTIIGKNSGGAGNRYSMYLNSGVIQYQFQDDSGSALGVDSAGNISGANDGTWHHITATFEGSTGVFKAYKDGVLFSTSTGSATTDDMANTGALIFGGGDYAGLLDDIRIYNYVRTPGQIIQDMNAGHPAPGSPIGTPYGYWRFDEGADNTCPSGADACNSGSGGSAIDANQSNMAVPASSTSGWTTAGKFGKALNFDGSNDLLHPGDISGTDGVSQATWSLWVKPGTLGTQTCLWCKVNSPTGTVTQSSWAIMTDSSDSSRIRAIIANAADDISQYGTSPAGTLTNGVWTHITVVYDGTLAASERIKIYKNGNPVTTTITGTIPTTIRNSTSFAAWGRAPNNTTALFSGTLDEPKLYLQSLTAEQVKVDMNRGSSQVLGALSKSSDAQPNSASNEYCPPDPTASVCGGPVAEWKFDEATGTTAIDSSGNANTGTISGATYINGKINKSLSFNGTTDYVSIADSSSLDLTTNFTIEAWVNIAGTPSDGNTGVYNIFNKGRDSTSTYAYNFDIEDNRRVAIRLYDGTNNPQAITTTALPIGTWNHVAATYNGSILRVYINGKLSALQATTVNPGAQTSAAAIGKNAMADNRYFNGKIDNVRVFNYARNDLQIAWSYSKAKPIATWRFDECQGTTIHDAVNSLNGTFSVGSGGITTVGTCITSGAWFNGVAGIRNYSLDFDGTDDVVTIPDDPKLDPSAAGWSVSLWANPANSDQNVALISKRETSGSFTQWSLYICGNITCDSSGQNLVGLFIQDNSNKRIAISSADVADGNWHNYVMVADRENDIVRLYMDGRPLATTSEDDGAWPNIANAIDVKIANNNEAAYFDGQIDDVNVYDFPLNNELVKQIYNDGAARFGPASGAP